MTTHPDKSGIARRSAAQGRPLSVPLAAVVLGATGGNPDAVDAAIVALIGVANDGATSRTVVDAATAHFRSRLGEFDDATLSVLALGRYALDRAALEEILVDGVDSAVAAATRSGILDAAGVPVATAPLADALGAARSKALIARLFEYRVSSGTLDPTTAVTLARDGLVDARLAEFLIRTASSADSAAASDLFDAAVRAGADAGALAPRRAEVAAVLGNLDDAESLADVVLEHSESYDTADVRTAVRVSATVAAERGMLGRSAALYRWLGADRTGVDSAIAAVVAVATGDCVSAEIAAAESKSLPPTSTGAAASLLATGLLESVTGTSAVNTNTAMNALMRAVTLSTATAGDRSVPDSSAAMTALLALHGGDLGRADSIVARALTTFAPSSAAWTRMHLIGTWSVMLSGDLTEAQKRVDAVRIPLPHQRNQLFLHALRVGLARRSGDAGSLSTAWDQAQDVIAEYSIDLFALLPLGELTVAATRLGRIDRIAHLLGQADALLADLGDPPAWASALHWYRVQSAILAEQPAELVPHAKALASAAETYPYSAALAAAGRAWLGVLQGRPDADAVAAAAQLLAGYGLSWDGARLASEAALRVAETSTATTLLQVARSLRQTAPSVEKPGVHTRAGSLSEREAEVAELLVLGVTYREVGSRLYISAKTVEHHVARIRRRLGATSRSELMSMLRALGYGVV